MATLTKPNRKAAAPYWYRLHIGECPVCGRPKTFRERVAGKRPEKAEDRIVLMAGTETYDHCLERGGG